MKQWQDTNHKAAKVRFERIAEANVYNGYKCFRAKKQVLLP